MRVLLINSNRLLPPIAPVALDYLGAALRGAGHEVEILDLCFEQDPLAAIRGRLQGAAYGLIGLSVRNTEDCYYPGRAWFVPGLRPVVECLRSLTDAPVVLGGVGFSVMPEAVLDGAGADLGIRGEGEFSLVGLANGEQDVPGLVRRVRGGFESIPPRPGDLSRLPPMTRDLADNERYWREGGQVGFETKRGCSGACTYCVDPLAKGRTVRLRPPKAVADEVASLAGRGIVHLHTCDSEFNRPLAHAADVCAALIDRGLGERVRWYAYCAPTPFPDSLAEAMRRAGCAGILMGVDSGDDAMLRRLGRDFTADDVRAAAERCRRHGLASYFTLLIGAPGESEESIRRSLSLIQECGPDLVGVAVGVRVFPGTPLHREVLEKDAPVEGPGAGAGGFAAPTYTLSPGERGSVFSLVREAVGADPRFLVLDPEDNTGLAQYLAALGAAIERGYRGAHWDIMRRVHLGLPPL